MNEEKTRYYVSEGSIYEFPNIMEIREQIIGSEFSSGLEEIFEEPIFALENDNCSMSGFY